jgi:YHS domain-containing protein
MQVPEEYDVLVLGSGEAGKYIAWTFAKKGMRTAVIERKYVGGSCPNIACLPSKNVIQSAKVASYVRRSEEFGIAKDDFRIDMSTVRDRKRRMIDGLIQLHLDNYKRSGAELIIGSGRFVAPKTLEVALLDVVAYFTENRRWKGILNIRLASYQGAIYYFSSAKDLAIFKNNPSKYVPQYGGFCANSMKNRKAVAADPTVFFVVKGKLYVCSSPEAEKEFRANEKENIKKADQSREDEYEWFY